MDGIGIQYVFAHTELDRFVQEVPPFRFPPLQAQADETIVPGQPLPWSYLWRRPSQHADITWLQVVLSFEGNEVYRESVLVRPTETLVERRPPSLRPPSSVAAAFWRIGYKGLDLLVSGLDASRVELQQWRQDFWFDVHPEPLDLSWWAWVSPPRDSIQGWNRDYTARGSFHNRSRYAAFSLEGHLWERNITDRRARESGGTASGMAISAGASSVLGFPPRRQTWQWLVPVVWVVTGPTQKEFALSAELSARDEYGNAYTLSTDEQLFVVRVSQEKYLFGSGAMGSATLAAALALSAAALLAGVVTAPAAPGAFTAASIAYGAANAAGARALDPPELDTKFGERVPLETRVVSPNEFDEYPGLSSFFEQFSIACRLLDQLDAVLGKIAGAQAASDKASAELQKADLEAGQAILGKMRHAMETASGAALKELRAMFEKEELLEAVAEWERTGVPNEVMATVREKAPEEVSDWLDEIGVSRDQVGSLATGAVLETLDQAMSYAAMALREELSRLQG